MVQDSLAVDTKITNKQYKLASAIVESKLSDTRISNIDLAKKAGYSLKSEYNAQLAHRLTIKPAVQNEVQRQFRERGLDVLAQNKVQEILQLQADDPKTVQVQLDAVKEIHKVMGSYADQVKRTEKLSLKLPGGV